jgi:hypothetical protein
VTIYESVGTLRVRPLKVKNGQPNFRIRSRLWSSGQSCCLQTQRCRVQFPALLDFLSSSGSETGYTQPREDN